MRSHFNQKPIRVAMLIQSYHPHVGGAERQLATLSPRLQEMGVDVQILTRRYPGLKSFEKINGIPVYRLPIPGPKPMASLFFTIAAQPLLYRLKPDLIHAHELLSPTTTAVLAKRIFGVPVVAKVLRGGQLGDIAKLKRSRSGRQRLVVMGRHVDAFITISQEIDRELASLNIPQSKRPFIPNGVDTERFSPVSESERETLRQKLNLPNGLTAVYTGRLVEEKQIDKLIEIWPQIRAVQPNANLILLGTGEQETKLKQQAGEGIVFRGAVVDVSPYLKGADLFILPSATEGLSNALLEAMSVGLPSVASNVGGAPDLITHNYSGLLIAPDAPTDLAKNIISLLNDKLLRQKLGSQARKKIIQDYSLPSVVEKLYDLYTRLLFTPNSQPHQETGTI